MMPVGGNTAAGTVPTGYPVNVSGVDPVTGKAWRVAVDSMGRLTPQGQSPAALGIQNQPTLNVLESSQTEGQSISELLVQILRELQIFNLKLHELPRILHTGLGLMSDEPSSLRNDPTLLG